MYNTVPNLGRALTATWLPPLTARFQFRGLTHVVRPSDGSDEVVVWAKPTVRPELEGGPGEEWALGEDHLLFAAKDVFRRCFIYPDWL